MATIDVSVSGFRLLQMNGGGAAQYQMFFTLGSSWGSREIAWFQTIPGKKASALDFANIDDREWYDVIGTEAPVSLSFTALDQSGLDILGDSVVTQVGFLQKGKDLIFARFNPEKAAARL